MVVDDLVSVIVPVYNRPELLIDAVNSVLQQDYRPVEIIIVNDGSTDQTLDVANDLAEQHVEIQVVTQNNAGPGVARETGRLLACGEFIQYLDSDDLLLKNKFIEQVKALKSLPSAGLAYGMECQINHGEAFDEQTAKPHKSTGKRMSAIFPDILYGSLWGTSVPLWRRRLTDEMGPWMALINEEDIEYDARAGALKTELAYVSQYVAVQRVHDDHLSFGGTTDPVKLQHRAQAGHAISQHALNVLSIGGADLRHFSKTVFLLARQCAAAGLKQESESLVQLSKLIRGGSGLKLNLFHLLLKLLGPQKAYAITYWFELNVLYKGRS